MNTLQDFADYIFKYIVNNDYSGISLQRVVSSENVEFRSYVSVHRRTALAKATIGIESQSARRRWSIFESLSKLQHPSEGTTIWKYRSIRIGRIGLRLCVLQELGSTMRNVKEKLGELRKDVTVLHRSATPPLVLRHQIIVQDCSRLNETLEQIHVELERLKSIFQSIWQEQIYRIHVEQDIFQQQVSLAESATRSWIVLMVSYRVDERRYKFTRWSQTAYDRSAKLGALCNATFVVRR